MSIDALRGFNMMFIMGAAAFFIALAKLCPNTITNAIAGQMTHVSWDGFRHHDMIFPLFLFLAGVSFPFSLAKQKEKGKSTFSIYRKIFIRMILLIIFGIAVGNTIKFDFANMRYASVLGHIGIAWAIAAVIYMNTRFVTRVLLSVFILIGYWFLLALVPAPDVNKAECFTHEAYVQRAYHLLSPDEQIKKNLTMEGCIVGYVDRTCLPGRLYKKIHDPEGILSVIPAIITALLGTMAGGLLRRDPKLTSPNVKTLILLFAGAILIAIGYYWNFVFPINKNLWSSSFVCFVGGISMMALGVFYYIIDVLRLRMWAFFFVVIGVNSITIYIAQRIIGFDHARKFIFDGM
ncbi:MAG: DUF5009 domain-containing protein, partial [Planctomycetia bacterium]|nr:DUF5009 domain-containing protein [Planctomycetia bacterium]